MFNSAGSVLAETLVMLVGGNSTKEGNVFAFNPATRHFGPVCDDDATITAVSLISLLQVMLLQISNSFKFQVFIFKLFYNI